MQSQALSPKQPSQWTQWTSLWQFSSYKPRPTRALPQIKRALRDCTQAERVIKEEQDLESATQMETQQGQVTPSPTFQVEYTKDAALADSLLPQITQEEYEAP
jgi:hypothetical protein